MRITRRVPEGIIISSGRINWMAESARVFYRCVKCGKSIEKEKLVKVAETRCPYCGFNVLKKDKPGTAKLIITSKLSEEQKLFVA